MSLFDNPRFAQIANSVAEYDAIVSAEDAQVLIDAVERLEARVAELESELAARGDAPQMYMTPGGRVVSHAERVAAAKARIVADEKRNIDTPEWIRRLAEDS